MQRLVPHAAFVRTNQELNMLLLHISLENDRGISFFPLNRNEFICQLIESDTGTKSGTI